MADAGARESARMSGEDDQKLRWACLERAAIIAQGAPTKALAIEMVTMAAIFHAFITASSDAGGGMGNSLEGSDLALGSTESCAGNNQYPHAEPSASFHAPAPAEFAPGRRPINKGIKGYKQRLILDAITVLTKHRGHELRPIEIAQASGTPINNITGQLDSLAAKGLIKKRRIGPRRSMVQLVDWPIDAAQAIASPGVLEREADRDVFQESADAVENPPDRARAPAVVKKRERPSMDGKYALRGRGSVTNGVPDYSGEDVISREFLDNAPVQRHVSHKAMDGAL